MTPGIAWIEAAGRRAAWRLLCLGFAAAAIGSWVLVAVDHVAGTWLALARAAAEGTLYPPLYDAESFGGTRYMPVPMLVHGGLGRLLDDYLVAGKLIAFVLMAALLALVVVVIRAQGCPTPVCRRAARRLVRRLDGRELGSASSGSTGLAPRPVGRDAPVAREVRSEDELSVSSSRSPLACRYWPSGVCSPRGSRPSGPTCRATRPPIRCLARPR